MISDGQYSWLRKVRLSEHRLDDRSINKSTELPKTSKSNGTATLRAQEAIVANIM